MRRVKSIWLIINYKTLIVTVLAVISTYLCGMFGIKAEFPLTLIGIAIVFPVVFSIDSAYKRRERVLSYLADFKAHLKSIYLGSRDWISPPNDELREEVKIAIKNTYQALETYCTATPAQLKEQEGGLYRSIAALSTVIQKFRKEDMYLGELSRLNQYVSKITVDIENIKAIRQYPTPVTLRAYSKVFIFSFPVLYGPYFEFIAESFSHGLEYMMPIVFSFILVSLDNIQEHLENPFDQVGEDDVHFDVDRFMGRLK